MEALATLGVAAATPIVLQFILVLLFTPEQRQKIQERLRIALSLAIGGVLAVLLAIYQDIIPADMRGWFFLALNGVIDGGISAGAVSLGFKVVKNVRSVSNYSQNGTYSTTHPDPNAIVE